MRFRSWSHVDFYTLTFSFVGRRNGCCASEFFGEETKVRSSGTSNSTRHLHNSRVIMMISN